MLYDEPVPVIFFEIRMATEGFVGIFTDIARPTIRPVIGWNTEKKKVIIAIRPNTTVERGRQTLINLGCSKGITLDAGGSSILRVSGRTIHSTTRRLYSVISW